MHVLDEAKALTRGDRASTYGPFDSEAGSLAAFWSDYLEYTISKHDVAMMLVLLKINRIKCGRDHRDNYVDGPGYFGLAAELKGYNTDGNTRDEPEDYACPAS